MKVEIGNDRFSAIIDSFGAELQSFKNKKTDEEYIWQRDPTIWDRSAPILFPVVGRMKNGVYCFNGKIYEMPLHGFAWTSEFTCTEHESDRVVFALKDSSKTRRVYPFAFELLVQFCLMATGLSVEYTVINPSNVPLWFTLGSHPAFALQSALENYRLRFSKDETLNLYGIRNNLLEKIQDQYLCNEAVIPLHKDLFNDDALIFLNIVSDAVTLEAQNGTSITLQTGEAPHIGFWAKPNAPYVCIEPWYSVDETKDHDGQLMHRPGIIRLPGKEKWRAGYTVLPFAT